jgi:hypothetical protein
LKTAGNPTPRWRFTETSIPALRTALPMLLAVVIAGQVLAAGDQMFEAETATLTGGAGKVAAAGASGGSLVSLSQPGQSIQFNGVPVSSKLAIRYATTNAGTISVEVNDEPARKVNVHSSGAFTNSFLHAIFELVIPANATLTISVATNNVAVNIDRQRCVGGNRHFNDRAKKGIRERARGMNIHFARRFVVHLDADRACVGRGVSNRQLAADWHAIELHALIGLAQRNQ